MRCLMLQTLFLNDVNSVREWKLKPNQDVKKQNLYITYKITNLVNNKIYIGQTGQPLVLRFRQHLYTLGRGEHKTPALQKDYNKYGGNQLDITPLVFSPTREGAEKWEKFYIAKYNTNSVMYGYNMDTGGSEGRRYNQEVRDKVSAANKGKEISTETREKIRMGHKGKVKDKVWKINIAEAQRGKHKFGKWLPVVDNDGFIWPGSIAAAAYYGTSQSQVLWSIRKGRATKGQVFTYLIPRGTDGHTDSRKEI